MTDPTKPRPTELHFATRAVHAGTAPDPATGARAQPIYFTNGFVFESNEQAADIFAMRATGFSYSRGSNPTVAALERRVASLESAKAAVAVASGQSAMLLVLMTLMRSGDAYVASSRLFGGSLGLMRRLEGRYDLVPQFTRGLTPEDFEAAITDKTRAVVCESIVNPCGTVIDLEGVAAVAHKHGLPLIVDNTLASPALIRPIEHGADIVVHSTSKFLSGSGTVIGGIVCDGGRFDWKGTGRYNLINEPWPDYDGLVVSERFPETAFAVACRLFGLRDLGPGLSPMNAFLTLTGTETLPLRMERHCANARAVAAFLKDHPKVAWVSYPSLPGQPGEAMANRYSPMGAGSIFTVGFKGGEAAAQKFITGLNLISHLVNIGEIKSLAIHPATTTHRQLPAADKEAARVGPDTVRLSIGLESVEDLIADVAQSLDALA
ncbi:MULTISPECIES: O-acetylhomoserine aminocarboxypropyltransferase/cysteine synthase family protein [Methylobacterium]|jgi:O-acetylhomoserine (thiol)-lyase|uniref:O-acetylhomoserine aminocarboxypropyltransferase/cysteine synthase family protein n=1 Tax=Methylobacterium TaxID=407 RepID=UPI0008E32141|nr:MULTISPECIES: O-acetylhomoserine aminocarboxypropyltransferase/cysteine synthase family protein [Methylobacterium]MBZ6411396.1 O-acetylhomoserine aminocarboxypropyltransferase/cysteine synthase [Methylobacterium sp.]MBK3399475.1 O-acetylhomoserine aminocarboxypropyltransferase/cysteine synthase [Methylobacterium ajmalii]MBK3407018.1 O-acetylhomoserine aminocarboxypropyltransferase/cysteine synthase [Methylobacterium ajmalii]MBK3423953.1 O-acetylhomoserine aminocarboxypropyltransferase/cystei